MGNYTIPPHPREHLELSQQPMEEEEEEPDPVVLPLKGVSSSSDEVVALASPSPPDCHKPFQGLWRKVVDELQIPLQETPQTPGCFTECRT